MLPAWLYGNNDAADYQSVRNLARNSVATGAQPGSQMKRGGKWMEKDEPICATSCCLPNYNTRNDFSSFKLRFKERKNPHPHPQPPQKRKMSPIFCAKQNVTALGGGLLGLYLGIMAVREPVHINARLGSSRHGRRLSIRMRMCR